MRRRAVRTKSQGRGNQTRAELVADTPDEGAAARTARASSGAKQGGLAQVLAGLTARADLDVVVLVVVEVGPPNRDERSDSTRRSAWVAQRTSKSWPSTIQASGHCSSPGQPSQAMFPGPGGWS
jgi:hypothetical protein